MFAPKKKMSKSRTGRRTTAWKNLNAKRLLDTYTLAYDSEGKAQGLVHHVSQLSGEYKGRSVVAQTKKSTKVKTIRA